MNAWDNAGRKRDGSRAGAVARAGVEGGGGEEEKGVDPSGRSKSGGDGETAETARGASGEATKVAEDKPLTAAEVKTVSVAAAKKGGFFSGKENVAKPEPVAPFVPPPIAPPAIEGDLTATAVVKEVIRMSLRDLVPVAVLICVAGAAAQVVNLGGTFILALMQVHDIELIATVFLAGVQFWKLCCEITCKMAVMRNARDVDTGDVTGWARASPLKAWSAVWGGFEGYKQVLMIDARRCLSIAWNSLITIPIPYLGLIKLLDYALCVPVFLFEGKVGKWCLARSMELMYGSRMLFLKTVMLLMGVFSVATGLVIGGFMVLCPTLPTLLLPPQVEPATGEATAAAAAEAAAWAEGLAAQVGEEAASRAAEEMVATATSGPTYADAAKGIFSGSAFDRVWDVGTPAEKWATIALLSFAVFGSFAFTVVLRQLIYVFHREVSARWKPPPPVEEGEEGGGFLRKLRFWRKDESSLSEKDGRTEGEKERSVGNEGDESPAPKPTSA